MKKGLKFLILLFAIALTGCSFPNNSNSSENNEPTEQQEEFDMNLIEDSKTSKIVKDYTYMYHIDGLKDSSKDRIAFFSDNYQMMIDCRNAKLLGLRPTNIEEMVEPNRLTPIASTFQVEIDSNKYQIINNGEGRIIDSGRYINRYDNVALSFNGLDKNNYVGRVEYIANRDYVVFNYELYSSLDLQFNLIATFTLSGYQLSKADNRSVMAVDNEGNGFVFTKQTTEDDIELTIQNNNLIIKKSISSYTKNQFCGLGVMIIPYYQDSTACYDRFLANEKAVITAKTKKGESLEVRYDSTEGIHYIDHNSIHCTANSNIYDDIDIKIQNSSASSARPIICFYKTTSVSITGVSPVLLDVETHEPTGEQVQISKNWHSSNSTDPADSPKRYYQGPWLHAYTRINVESNKEEMRNYLLAYGRWGEAFAASHAQLCLIGWGGYQVWDQSALGSWGESVTYDPDIGLNRSMLDDVRPFQVTGPTGGNMQYNWTGNVGGADFLRYSDINGYHNIINQRISYITQAPNVTNVNYGGQTSDNKIKTSITINMGRTDDLFNTLV